MLSHLSHYHATAPQRNAPHRTAPHCTAPPCCGTPSTAVLNTGLLRTVQIKAININIYGAHTQHTASGKDEAANRAPAYPTNYQGITLVYRVIIYTRVVE